MRMRATWFESAVRCA